MTVPVLLLALGSICAGWLGTPTFMWGGPWEHWLGPLFGALYDVSHGEPSKELFFMLLTVGIVATGIYLAYHLYGSATTSPNRTSRETPGRAYRLLANGYYVDELYDFLLIRPLAGFALWLADVFDSRVVDGFVNGLAEAVRHQGFAWRQIQSGYIQHYLFGFLAGSVLLLGYYIFR
jgi:NADH-quinone oxidoreductase subunit L